MNQQKGPFFLAFAGFMGYMPFHGPHIKISKPCSIYGRHHFHSETYFKPSGLWANCAFKGNLSNLELGSAKWSPERYDMPRHAIASGKAGLYQAASQKVYSPESVFKS